MFERKYDYINKDEVQYTKEDLEEDIVRARYKRALDEYDEGNFAIEALPPRYYSEEEVDSIYSVDPRISVIKGPEFDAAVREAQVQHLKEMRLPLPYTHKLQKSIHNALLSSYRRRIDSMRKGGMGTIVVNNKIVSNPIRYKTDKDGNCGDTALALLASPGCGKTSALKLVLSTTYPQHIIHELPDLGTVHQITYLEVECPEQSNIQELLNEIGVELDKVLGNSNKFCANEIQRAHTIEAKKEKVCDFIRSYNVGAIVIDEIQKMNFTITSAKSFNTFLGIINNTDVCVFLAGQIDAYEKITEDAQVERRIGTIIIAQDYCFDREVFRSLANSFSTYSWRDNGKELLDPYGRQLSDSEIDALFKVTSGTIDLLSKCWRQIQEYGIETGDWPELTYKFVHDMVQKKKPNSERLIRERILAKAEYISAEAYNNLKNAAALEDEVEQTVANAAIKGLTVKQPKTDKDSNSLRNEVLIGAMKYNTNNNNKWTSETIEKIVDEVLGYKKYKWNSVEELVKICTDKMESHGSDKKTGSSKKVRSAKGKSKKNGISELMDVTNGLLMDRESEQTPA